MGLLCLLTSPRVHLEIYERYEQTDADTPLEVVQGMFDQVQIELLELMQHDSYRRFISSDFYQRYKRGEDVPHDRRQSRDSTKSQTIMNDEPDFTTVALKSQTYGEIPAQSVSLTAESSAMMEGSTPRGEGIELHSLDCNSPGKDRDNAWAVQ